MRDSACAENAKIFQSNVDCIRDGSWEREIFREFLKFVKVFGLKKKNSKNFYLGGTFKGSIYIEDQNFLFIGLFVCTFSQI